MNKADFDTNAHEGALEPLAEAPPSADAPLPRRVGSLPGVRVPLEGSQGPGEGVEARESYPHPAEPPEGVVGPTSAITVGPPNPVRDTVRVVRDGLIYGGILAVAYRWGLTGVLDNPKMLFLLLLAGIRAQTVAEFVSRRVAQSAANGGRAASALVALVGLDFVREAPRFFRG